MRKRIIDSDISQIFIGESDSQVYRITTRTSDVFFLKLNEVSRHLPLQHEAEILQWLQRKISVPEVVEYGRNDKREYILLTAVPGISCFDTMSTLRSSEIATFLAKGLREIHQIDITGCPFDESLGAKLIHAQENLELDLVDESDFDEERQGKTGQQIMDSLRELRPEENDYVFNHGDYCLPNVMLQPDHICGFIDLGRAGISDRYNDLAIASRSIHYNLGAGYEAEFFCEYGLESVDCDRIAYYRMLDEMF